MAHLAGVNKGPVLDWTDDNGLMEHFRKWKKRVEILFRDPLNAASNGVKCSYIIYWLGETGMGLVDKWETEGKITDANRNNIARYFEFFEEHILPESNALIMIVVSEKFQKKFRLKKNKIKKSLEKKKKKFRKKRPAILCLHDGSPDDRSAPQLIKRLGCVLSCLYD